jgi:hypothetical protein
MMYRRNSLMGIVIGTIAAGLLSAGAMVPTFKVGPSPSMISTQPTRKRRTAGNGAGRLNRSRHWRPARTYKEARAISPFPDRPVR